LNRMLLLSRGRPLHFSLTVLRPRSSILIAGLARVFALVLLLQQSAQAANRTWNNSGTDFNAGASWGGTPPGSSDIAVFNVAAITQPNLSASLTIKELNFSTTASSGYDITSSNTNIKL